MHNVFDDLFVWGALIKIFAAFYVQASKQHMRKTDSGSQQP